MGSKCLYGKNSNNCAAGKSWQIDVALQPKPNRNWPNNQVSHIQPRYALGNGMGNALVELKAGCLRMRTVAVGCIEMVRHLLQLQPGRWEYSRKLVRTDTGRI